MFVAKLNFQVQFQTSSALITTLVAINLNKFTTTCKVSSCRTRITWKAYTKREKFAKATRKLETLLRVEISSSKCIKLSFNSRIADDASYQVDIDYTGVPITQMDKAKVLFETVASVLNRSARGAISVNANFYEIGGNSVNSIYTISRLNERGCYISKCAFFIYAIVK